LEHNPYYVLDYDEELAQLAHTYEQAMGYDVSAFAAWLREHRDEPMLAIGAGGSLPIAEMAVRLHYLATGRIGKSSEPIELFNLNPRAQGFAGLLVTASGGHSDSLASCKRLGMDLGGSWAVFCGKENSAGEGLLAGSQTPVFAYELLPDVHGWIAVNALLGQAVVLARAFIEAYPEHFDALPQDIGALLPEGVDSLSDALDALVESLGSALSRERLVFLYGPDTKAAALDLDSKFAESGLGKLVLSEYRNFAHGRYQELLPDPDKYGVVAFVTPYEEKIAVATLAEIPSEIASAGVTLPTLSGAAEQVSALLTQLFVVGALARVRGIRPGWGSRGTFGDVLYEFTLDDYFPVRLRQAIGS